MAHRDEMIQGLRELADMLESHAEVTTPYDIRVNAFWTSTDDGLGDYATPETARAAMTASPGGWTKTYTESNVCYEKEMSGRVSYRIFVGREMVCTRVQVGTRHVDATPAHDEPVFEWVCDE